MIRKLSITSGDAIRVRGVRQNNLQGIDCDIPLGRLTVITGVSGSGKSSLAFDTLYAEGQRRYLETFSAYTRQFLERIPRPDLDSIEGIPPAVAIDPYGAIKTSRSTVGTMTGIDDYLKLLYSRASDAFCSSCGERIEPRGRAAALAALARTTADSWPVLVLAPLALGGFDDVEIVRRTLVAQGYMRCVVAGEVRRVEELEAANLEREHLDVVIDRLAAKSSRARCAEAVEAALRLTGGALRLLDFRGEMHFFSEGLRCDRCRIDLPEPTPGLFSFNNPYGACAECRGFGRVIELDWRRVVPDESLSLAGGAVRPWNSKRTRPYLLKTLRELRSRGVATDVPFSSYPPETRELILEGGPGYGGVRGFFRRLERKKYKMHVRVFLSRFRGYEPCPACDGARLRPEALCFRVRGQTLPDLWRAPVRDVVKAVGALAEEELPRPVRLIVDETRSRLEYLDAVGLGYLTLGRQSRTLSGGEVERVNLTSALGAALVDTLFVLDEPSIGLHARDGDRLLGILRAVRDRGNTVVVVEHDPQIMAAADWLMDLGPGSGERGGRLVAAGPARELSGEASSLTGEYLSGARRVFEPREPRALSGRALRVRGARANNLGGAARGTLDVDLPVDGLVVVTGVSGSGKSTLIGDVVWRAWLERQGKATDGVLEARAVNGFESVDDVVLVDQSPIGRTPRGNPATYTKVFDRIRAQFAASEGARERGLGVGHFSFNVEGGRCPECAGAGWEQVEMQFLSDVTLRCDACGGTRFRPEVLEVRLRGKNVDDVLGLTIREAAEFFAADDSLAAKLRFLESLGLGYLRLGQPIHTLSGGEAQRLKLAGRVLKAAGHRLLFLLDEPTTGLHLHDVRRLIEVLDRLVDDGHGVIVVEHHLDFIAAADHVVDLGPEGGDGGGLVVAAGTPQELARGAAASGSITGEWLARHLDSGGRVPAPATPPQPRSRAATAPAIRVVGARENNLRGIDVSLPLHELVVITGLSGSGKSSLVYDIVFSEGQRRYLDCLSPYARQFVEDLHRPDIDHLEGIPPAVAIEQRTSIGGRKSTVGTVTEIYQLLRLLYARAGVQTCPDCREAVVARSVADIETAMRGLTRRGGRLLAPAVRGKKGFHWQVLAAARKRGVLEARIDGEWVELPDVGQELRLERQRRHDVDLVVGSYRGGGRVAAATLRENVHEALDLGGGVVRFVPDDGEETVFSRERACPRCDRSFDEPDPRNFSFHSRHGMCRECDGYGSRLEVDPERLIGRWNVAPSAKRGGPFEFLADPPFKRTTRARFLRALRDLERSGRWRRGLLAEPLAQWPGRALTTLMGGDDASGFEGLTELVERTVAALDDDSAHAHLARWGRQRPCVACGGGRLAPEWLAVQFGGRGIGELTRDTLAGLRTFFAAALPSGREAVIAKPIVEEVRARLEFLDRVGLDYITLDREVMTLSSGEAQRIRLASQLGSKLRGACYILDEPTIGLHPRDGSKLLDTLRDLRDRGNSVLVIEHDDATIEAADTVIEMGPGPGRHGGTVVVQGTLAEVLASEESATGAWFRGRAEQRPRLRSARLASAPAVAVRGASLHNLAAVDARFPLGALTVVTGVSGAGKSTLVRGVLEESVRRSLRGLRAPAAGCAELEGAELISAVREVDQMPIGRTPRSTPATYVGLWDRVRNVFASTPEARARGYKKRRFSFNVADGRCETCAGQGRLRVEMSFLPDVDIDCEVCRGRRFNDETLQVAYRGRSIADVLGMDVEEALVFFESFDEIVRSLAALRDLGLGYLTLGQASTTLSGGEAQRVKLAVELAKKTGGAALYLLDEPTTGLHMQDVDQLAGVLRRLADAGHAVVVIEHNLELIAGADHVVDLGPEGGEDGGKLLFQGPPAGLAKSRRSHTGRCLAAWLDGHGTQVRS